MFTPNPKHFQVFLFLVGLLLLLTLCVSVQVVANLPITYMP